MKKSLRFLQISLLLGSVISHAHAASGTWTNTVTGGNWSTPGNWSGNTIADGSTFTASFSTLDITADNTVHLDGPRTLTGLTFGDTTVVTAAGWILDDNATPANILTLAGTTPTITVSALGTAKTAAISAVIDGTVGMTKAGAGILVLSGANTVTGTVNVSGGTLRATTSASSLGAGALTLSGGTLQLANDTVLNFGRNTTVTADTTITADRLTSAVTSTTHTLGTLSIGAQTLNVTRGANITDPGIGGITFAGNVSMTGVTNSIFAPSANSVLMLSGVVSGSTGLRMNGVGTLVLSGANDYTGVTTITSGVLSTNSLAAGGSNSGIGASSGSASNLVFGAPSATLRYTGSTAGTLLRGFTMSSGAGGGATLDSSGTGSLTVDSAIPLNYGTTAQTRLLTLAGTSAANNSFDVSLTNNGSSALSLSKGGTTNWTLTGTNTFTGTLAILNGAKDIGKLVLNGTAGAAAGNVNAVTIGNGSNYNNGGVLELAKSDQINDTAVMTLGVGHHSGNSFFSLLGNSETIGGLVGVGSGNGPGAIVVQNGAGAGVNSVLTLNVATGTQSLNRGNAGKTLIRNGAAGTLSIVKNGVGTQVIGTGTFTHTGTTTINNGVLQLTGNSYNTSAIILAGGTLNLVTNTVDAAISGTSGSLTVTGGSNNNFGGGNKTYTGNTTISAASTVLTQTATNSLSANSIHSVGTGATLRTGNLAGSVKALTDSGAVDLNGASAILTLTDGAGQNFSGAMGGTGGLTKSGAGIQTLSGSNNYSGSTTVKGGTLLLDFALGGTSNILSSSSALVLGGGTLEIKGGSGETDGQTLNGVSGLGTLRLTPNGATAVDFTLGVIAAGSQINFVGSDATAGALGAANFLTTTTVGGNDGTTPLGGSLWNGTTWASTSNGGGATRVVGWAGSFSSLTTDGNSADPTGHLHVDGGAATGTAATFSANTAIGSLLMSDANNATTVALGGNTLMVNNSVAGIGAIAISETGKSLTLGSIAGDGVLTAGASGASTLILNNASTAGGLLTVNASITNGTSSSVALTTVGAVTLAGTNTYTGATTITSGMLTVSSSANQTLSGVISGVGALTKSGAGQLTLSNANGYTGGTTLSAGTLQLSNVSAAGSGGIILGDANTGGSAVRLLATAGSGNFANPITVSASGSGTATLEQSANFSTLSSLISLNRATTIHSSAPDRTGISGKITGNVGTLTFTGGRTTLDNTVANDFVGNVVVGSGALQTNAANALPSNASVTVNGSGVFQFNSGFSQSIDALLGGTSGTTGVQIIAGSAVTLTIGSNGGGGTFAGNIVNSAAALSITKTGSGTQTLSGANTFTGNTRVQGGTLAITNNLALQNSTLVWDNLGGTLDYGTRTALFFGGLQGAQNFTMQDSALTPLALTLGGGNSGGTFTGALLGGTTLTKTGTGTQILGGATSNTFTGTTKVFQGALSLGKTDGATALGNELIFDNNSSPDVYTTQNNQFASGTVVSFTNNVGDHGRLDLMGTTQTVAGIQMVGYSAQKGVIQNSEAIANTGSSTLVLNGAGTYTFTGYLRNQTGTLALTKSGSGTQTLAGNQIVYTGATLVSGGNLSVNLTAAMGTTSITVDGSVPGSNARFTHLANNNNFIPGAIPITVTSGTFAFGDNFVISRSAGLTLTNGTLDSGTMTGGQNTTWGAWLVTANQTITANGASFITGSNKTIGLQNVTLTLATPLVTDVLTVSGAIVPGNGGTGGIAKSGAGTTILSGANTFTGATAVNGGKLILDYTTAATVLGAIPLQMGGGELVFENLGTKNQNFSSTTVVSGASKLTRSTGYTSGVVSLGTLSCTSGSMDVSNITGSAGWIKVSNLPSTVLLNGAITTNGGTRPVATDASGFLITAATTDWSRGGAATGGAILRLVETGTGGDIIGAPITLAGADGSTTDVTGIFNGYSAAAAAPDTVINLDIGATKTLRLAAGGFVTSAVGTNLVLSNGTLTAGGAANTPGTITFNGTDTITVGSVIANNGSSGVVGLVKNDNSTTILSGANTYTGTTTINAGALALSGGNNRLPTTTTVDFAGSSTLNFGNITQSVTGLSMSGATAAGVIAGSGGTLNVTGSTEIRIGSRDFGASGNVSNALNIDNVTANFTPALVVGRNYSGNSGTSGTSALTIGSGGVLNANTLVVAETNYVSGAVAPVASGTLTIDGGFLKATTLTLAKSNRNNAPTNSTINLNNAGTLRAQTIAPDTTSAETIIFNWNNGTIRNNNASTDLTINAGMTSFKLVGTDSHIFDIDSGRQGTVAQAMSDTGALTKNGAGTLTLNGISTYAGTTTVNAGKLLANNSTALATNSATGTGTVTVKNNASLGGTGAVTGSVVLESGATLAPGVTNIESLATGPLTAPVGSTLAMEINSSGSPVADVVNVSGGTGNVTLSGTLNVTDIAVAPAVITPGAKLTLLTYTGNLTGDFNGLAEGSALIVGKNGFKIRYADGGKNVTLEAIGLYPAWLVINGRTHSDANLKEYALGTSNTGAITVNSPTSITLGQGPSMQISGTEVSAVFARRHDYQDGGLTYKVKFSTNLGTWFESTDTTNLMYAGSPNLNNPSVVASDGEMDAVSIPFPLFFKTANGFEKMQSSFMQIEVSIP